MQCGKCEEKKIKDQMENPCTSQPTAQTRRGPCVLISPHTRQGLLSGPMALPRGAGSLGREHSFILQALRVVIILGEETIGKYKQTNKPRNY